MQSFEGKVIAITGAASGIGLELTKILAARGAKLALADIRQTELEALISKLKGDGVHAIGTCLDVSKAQEVDGWVQKIVDEFEVLHGAANIAGVPGGKRIQADITELRDEDWDFVLSVNLTGLMYCLRAQLRVMKAGASIVNTASVAGKIGRAGMPAYTASKHGIIGLTRAVAKESGRRGIRVNVVAPGPTDTVMLTSIFEETDPEKGFEHAYDSMPLGRKGQAEEIARTFAFLLSDESSFTTGAVYSCDGGVTC